MKTNPQFQTQTLAPTGLQPRDTWLAPIRCHGAGGCCHHRALWNLSQQWFPNLIFSWLQLLQGSGPVDEKGATYAT